MDKHNLIGLGVMAVASAAVIAGCSPLYQCLKDWQLKAAAGGEAVTVLTGEAEGYGGPVTAQVTVAGDRCVLHQRGDCLCSI